MTVSERRALAYVFDVLGFRAQVLEDPRSVEELAAWTGRSVRTTYRNRAAFWAVFGPLSGLSVRGAEGARGEVKT